jgi:hypothetical protein
LAQLGGGLMRIDPEQFVRLVTEAIEAEASVADGS